MSETGNPKTLSEKLWERHLVHEAPGEQDLLYIDMHLVHEVTSPQAFDGLRLAGKGSAGLHQFGRAGKVASRTPSSSAP